MADYDPDQKLIIKAGTCKDFLGEFSMNDDGENFQFGRLEFANRRIETVNKCFEEAKYVTEL